MIVNGVDYNDFDRNVDQVLKWGLYVPLHNPLQDKSLNETHVVLEDFVFWSSRYQIPVVVPRWFVTDLASIPKSFRWLISKIGVVKIPSLLHDFGYALNSLSKSSRILSRKDWDLMFSDSCESQGMGSINKSIVYSAVRVGGSSAFKSKKQVFLSKSQKDWYLENYHYLNLNRENGEYIVY